MRNMGQLPMTVADYAEDLRVIKALLNGETVDYTANGRTHPVSFQSLELDYVILTTQFLFMLVASTSIAGVGRRVG